jgi:AAA family ATP:ADP antiporter
MKAELISFLKKFNSLEIKRMGILMFLFFLAMSVFWTLKPIRKSLFIGYFKENPFVLFEASFGGAQVEQLAKLSLVIAALIAALFFPYLFRRFAMRQVLVIFCGIGIFGLLGSSYLISEPNALFVWGFYVLGDLINSLIITLLWMILHNSVNTEKAIKIYSLIGVGMVAGGMFGAFFLYQGILFLGHRAILLVCLLPIGIVALLGHFIACRITDSEGKMKNCLVVYQQNIREKNKDGKLFGFSKIGSEKAKNRKYWIGIALLVGLYEISSGIIDFQLSVVVENLQVTAFEREMYFGMIGQYQSFLALIVQVFVTGWILKRWGVGIALLILPIATLFGSVGFFLIPTLTSVMFLSISDNALNYSVNQSVKETLYVPADSEERIAAKSVIDLFVQRFAKAFALILNLFLVTLVSLQNVRWLSLIAIGLMIFWIFVARKTSREFEKFSGQESKPV